MSKYLMSGNEILPTVYFTCRIKCSRSTNRFGEVLRRVTIVGLRCSYTSRKKGDELFMQFEVFPDYNSMSDFAAKIVVDLLTGKPQAVLGLCTGGTPVGLYERLVAAYNRRDISFRRVSTFNLDEYVGLSPTDRHSYRMFMNQVLFDHVDIVPSEIHFPNGCVDDLNAECKAYDWLLNVAGGIELQILGIGANGHIGFNEPGTDPVLRTRVVNLQESTVKANSRFFDEPRQVPRQAITMGIANILEAKRILLLATGRDKAQAIELFLTMAPNPNLPASYLKDHSHLTVLVDKDAAELVKQ